MFGFPLLLIPFAIFNIIVFLMPGVVFTAPAFSLELMSGVVWTVTLGDILVTLGMLMLLFEVIKAARAAGRYLTDHLLSLIVLGAAGAEFLLLPQFGNSTFFLLCVLAFVDFFMGTALHRRRAKRQVAEPAAAAPAPVPAPAPVAPAPVAAPEPAPAVTPAPAAPAAPAERIEPRLDTLQSAVPSLSATHDAAKGHAPKADIPHLDEPPSRA